MGEVVRFEEWKNKKKNFGSEGSQETPEEKSPTQPRVVVENSLEPRPISAESKDLEFKIPGTEMTPHAFDVFITLRSIQFGDVPHSQSVFREQLNRFREMSKEDFLTIVESISTDALVQLIKTKPAYCKALLVELERYGLPI